MKITLTDKAYIEYDKYNFTPFIWQEEKTNDSGAHKGKTTPAKFVSSQKYFGTVSAAIDWLITERLINENESLTLSELALTYEMISKEMVEEVKRVMGRG